MRYVRQLSLLPCEEFFAESDDNTRLGLVLHALPDERLRVWLRQGLHPADDPLGNVRRFAGRKLYRSRAAKRLLAEIGGCRGR